jgi:competence protein ComEC
MRLMFVCAAALLGIAIGDVKQIAEPWHLLFGVLPALLGACLAWRHTTWRWLALGACAVALGALRATTVERAPPSALEPYIGQLVRVGGRLGTPPTMSSSGASVRLMLDVETVGPPGSESKTTSWQPLGPLAVVGGPATFAAVEAGDSVVLEGRLREADSRSPPTLLFPRLVQRSKADAQSPIDWLANLRARAAAGIRRYLPEPQGSLSAGLLLGGSGQLDADFRLQLQRSGLAHLVAIDGYKQVIVAAALGAICIRVLGVRLATLPMLLGIAAYTLLTGAHPSAVRAALMVSLAAVGAVTGRVADPLTSLLLAVLAMALLEPRILLDVGLQLSLSATLGIILLWPRLRRRLRGIPGWMAEPAGLTLAVTLATLPVMLSVFQSVSLVSPVAHILAVPVLPVALASTALLAAVSSIEPLANAVAWLAWLPSTLLVEIIRLMGSLPGAALSTGRLPALAALGMATALLAWGLLGLPETRELRVRCARLNLSRRRYALPAMGVTASLAAMGMLELVRHDGHLHVDALSAGRGQAVLIRGPTGRTALVVAGRVDSAMLASQVADHLAVWEHRLDSVLPLDSAAEAGLASTLARYPADWRINAPIEDERIDLGGGAAIDTYSSAADGQAVAQPQVAVSFGQVWLLVLRRSPPPNLISDGNALWTASDGD